MDQVYKDEIKAMINHKRRRLIVNISDLHSFQDFGPRSSLLSPTKSIDLHFLKDRNYKSSKISANASFVGSSDNEILKIYLVERCILFSTILESEIVEFNWFCIYLFFSIGV